MKASKNILKYLAFGLTGGIIVVLIAATILEKIYGTGSVVENIYGSFWFCLWWGVAALTALIYMIRCKLHKHRIIFLLHLSFLVILGGALTTHISGVQGKIHLRQGLATRDFITEGNRVDQLPFTVILQEFRLDYYPGTFAPKDYVSTLLIREQGDSTATGEVSMNRIYSHRHYRFYQSTYDADGQGCTLAISYDPFGIALTYTGYGLLLASILLFFIGRESRFRQLLHSPLLRKSSVALLLMAAVHTTAQAAPPTLSPTAAEQLGDLYIYHNDRICPLQTMAKEFILKIYGKESYHGLTGEQVLAGWFFHYDQWKEEPMIRIKSPEVRRLLGISSEYASLQDYTDANGYKLENALQTGSGNADRRGVEEANEKFNLISMVCTGSIFRIYPYRSRSDRQPVWYSLTDRLPDDVPKEQWSFIHYSMNYVAEKVARNDEAEIIMLLEKIRKYQQKEAEGYLPSPTRFRAEKLYNKVNFTKPAAMGCITIGILTFILLSIPRGKQLYRRKAIRTTLLGLLCLLLAWLLVLNGLRGYVSGHLPLSNGFETMQFMAICTSALTLLCHRKFEAALSFGFLISGLALLVAMLGESNPPITQLMPVLASPLLSAHVVSIMIAYSLLAFTMLNGLSALILRVSREDNSREIARLQVISQLLLYPAVFLLTAGIFIGAVWANVSWGRYWGWDPKEVWALITMLIYAAALHPSSLPWFRKPMHFHFYMLIAFISVLITYFGVNFLLGGMHSYA